MDIFQLLEYCADIGFDGVDITGYYFPAYPEVPSDAYIYSVKKRAFELGLVIFALSALLLNFSLYKIHKMPHEFQFYTDFKANEERFTIRRSVEKLKARQ